MKLAFMMMTLVLASYPFQAQYLAWLPAQQDSLRIFDARMSRIKKTHGWLLASWATLNVLVGGILAFTTKGEPAYVELMNMSWGVVNGGMAAFIYFHHQKEVEQPKTWLRQMDIQRHVEKAFLLNIGLDVAFIVGGVALHQHGQLPGLAYAELWRGFGTSVILQGAFLLLQDYIFYRLHLTNRKKIHPTWERLMNEGSLLHKS